MTMDIDVKNIDKNDNNTWRTIYKSIDLPYFGEVKLFPKACLDKCKIIQKSHKIFHMESKRGFKPST